MLPSLTGVMSTLLGQQKAPSQMHWGLPLLGWVRAKGERILATYWGVWCTE